MEIFQKNLIQFFKAHLHKWILCKKKKITKVQKSAAKKGCYGPVYAVRNKVRNMYSVNVNEDKGNSNDSHEESVNNEINILFQCQ